MNAKYTFVLCFAMNYLVIQCVKNKRPEMDYQIEEELAKKLRYLNTSGQNAGTSRQKEDNYGKSDDELLENLYNTFKVELNITPEDKFTLDHANAALCNHNMEVVTLTEDQTAEINQSGISLKLFGDIVRQICLKKNKVTRKFILFMRGFSRLRSLCKK
ncbi:uncharacterized protein LOC126845180 [Adelges cooleyi]|uniref:uncharacterized protein LOC126845180 n=1 Tax=Adelges cooleyi TaxID=133065 RepID=UPI00217F988B|nr:uncharacterized protein LOC126845180 [Adelges cooleyi]